MSTTDVRTNAPSVKNEFGSNITSAAPGSCRRAAIAHGEHEKRAGEADANWPIWTAAYLVAEPAGTELPT